MISEIILALAALTAQADMVEATAYVYLDEDGLGEVELQLPAMPKNPDLILEHFVQAFDLSILIDKSAEDEDEPGAYFSDDGFAYHDYHDDDSWYAVAFPANRLDSDQGLLREQQISLGALDEALHAEGVRVLRVEFDAPQGVVLDVSALPSSDNFSYDDNRRAATIVLSQALPTVRVGYGFTRAKLIHMALSLAGFLLLPLLACLLIGKRATRAPLETVGFALYLLERRYLLLALLFWIFWPAWFSMHDPVLPLHFIAPEYANAWGIFAPLVLFVFGAASMILAHTVLHRAICRFPGSRWTHAGLLRKAFWINLFFGAVALLGTAAARYWIGDQELLALGLAGIAAFVCCLSYIRYRMSYGMRVDFLEEGRLRAGIAELAARANLDKPIRPGVLRIDRIPVLNALATRSRCLLVTDHLIAQLSKRETDAMLAHELGHLGAGHLSKIYWSQFFSGLVVPLLTMVLAVFTIIVAWPLPGVISLIGSAPLALVAFCATPPAMLLIWMHNRRLHKYEYEADAAAVVISEDPASLISALAKLTRLNRMPMTWGERRERWVTHPSTSLRIARIAEAAGIGEEERDRLARVGLEDDTAYELPRTVDTDRVFGARARRGIAWRNRLLVLLGPVFASICAASFPLVFFSMPLNVIVALPLATAVAVAAFWIADRDRWMPAMEKLRGAVLDRVRADGLQPPDDAPYVVLNPSGEMRNHDTMTWWDIGFVWWQDGQLHYAGDGAIFSMTAQRIRLIEPVNTRLGWESRASVFVRWEDPDGSEKTLEFSPVSTGKSDVRIAANQQLLEGLRVGWESQVAVSTTAKETLPRSEWASLGRDIRTIMSPRRYLLFLFLLTASAGFYGYILADLLAVPDETKLLFSLVPALAVGISSFLTFFPGIFLGAPKRVPSK